VAGGRDRILDCPWQIQGQHKYGKQERQDAELGEEDLARAHGESGERQAIPPGGKKRLPLDRGDERGDRACHTDKLEFIAADFREDASLGELALHFGEQGIEGGEDQQSYRDQRGEYSGRDRCPFPGDGEHFVVEEAAGEMPHQLEIAAVRLPQPRAPALRHAATTSNIRRAMASVSSA